MVSMIVKYPFCFVLKAMLELKHAVLLAIFLVMQCYIISCAFVPTIRNTLIASRDVQSKPFPDGSSPKSLLYSHTIGIVFTLHRPLPRGGYEEEHIVSSPDHDEMWRTNGHHAIFALS